MKMQDVLKTCANQTPQHAFDEAMRELDVRTRCYPKWISEGKLSRTDADTRIKGQAMIVAVLKDVPGVTSNTESDSSEWKPF